MHKVLLFSLAFALLGCGPMDELPLVPEEPDCSKYPNGIPKWRNDDIFIMSMAPTAVVNQAEALIALRSAAQTWNSFNLGPEIQIRDEIWDGPVEVSYDFPNLVMFEVDGLDGPLGISSTFYSDTGLRITRTDIRMNDHPSVGWSTNDNGEWNRPDFESVMLHELGHSIGLKHIDDDPEATMYPSIKAGSIDHRTPNASDVEALACLYAN